jgi:hypothetical protein
MKDLMLSGHKKNDIRKSIVYFYVALYDDKSKMDCLDNNVFFPRLIIKKRDLF